MKHLLIVGLLMALSTLIAVAWFARRPSSELARCLRKRFPQAVVTEEDDRITIQTGSATVVVAITQQRTKRSHHTHLDERKVIHVFAEVQRALRREPLGDTSLADLVPIPLCPSRTERIDEGARFVVRIHPELDVGFALRTPNSGQWLTEQDAAELDPNQIFEMALKRLHKTTNGATVYRDGALGRELYLIRQNDGLDASRLLLAPLWTKITDATGSPLVIAAPSRDRVYAAPADQPRSVERLMQHALEDWDSRAHPLTTRLWVWNDNQLEPWHLHA